MMGIGLNEAVAKKTTKTVVADIVKLGDKMIIPEGMSAKQALALLERRIAFEEEEVVIQDTFDIFPWDGAVVLAEVFKEKYGWVPAEGIETPFGTRPPELRTIEVGPGQYRQVPWGKFTVPGLAGELYTGAQQKKGRIVFSLAIKAKRKEEDKVRAFFDLVRAGIAKHSIYRGKVVRIRFTDEDGDTIAVPEPTFVDVSHIDEQQLIFSHDVQEAVNTSLFTPIRRAKDCIANKIPLKRGVLLGGTFGCGKTLAAATAARIASDSGITFVYAEKASDLSQAIEFARQYQSPAAVVFAEDIDRSISGGRTEKMDHILNVVDGIDSKTANVLVVLTTNAMQDIDPAMLRPGRLDAVIEITPPDSEAVQRLLRHYGGKMVKPEADLTGVGEILKGNIPAVVHEVVKRASLAQLAMQDPGTMVTELTPQALASSARTMAMQVGLMKGTPPKETPTLDESLRAVVKEAVDGHSVAVGKIGRGVHFLVDRAS